MSYKMDRVPPCISEELTEAAYEFSVHHGGNARRAELGPVKYRLWREWVEAQPHLFSVGDPTCVNEEYNGMSIVPSKYPGLIVS